MIRAILLVFLLTGCTPLACKVGTPEPWCPPSDDEHAVDAFDPDYLTYCEARP